MIITLYSTRNFVSHEVVIFMLQEDAEREYGIQKLPLPYIYFKGVKKKTSYIQHIIALSNITCILTLDFNNKINDQMNVCVAEKLILQYRKVRALIIFSNRLKKNFINEIWYENSYFRTFYLAV